MENRLLLIGGGGHCRSILDVLLHLNIYTKIGIVDCDKTITYEKVSVVGVDDELPKLYSEGWENAFISLGSVGPTDKRSRMFSILKQIGFNIPNVVDPSAIIADNVVIKEGVFVGKGVVINTGVMIDDGVIINTSAVVEHDCKVGRFAHISIAAILCGQVCVGANTHVGANSVVKQSTVIGKNSLIGIGSVVVRDIPDNVTAYGNPCKVVS